MSASFPFRVALVAAALLAVAACGRRGDLEPPNAAAVQPAKNALAVNRPSRTITPPNTSFVLDPLLK